MKKVYRTDGSQHHAAVKLLPEVELLEHCRELVDRTVEEAGRIVVETLLQLSAQNLTGPRTRAKRTCSLQGEPPHAQFATVLSRLTGSQVLVVAPLLFTAAHFQALIHALP